MVYKLCKEWVDIQYNNKNSRKGMINMKVKLFTHNDLDGIGCAILGKLAFNDIDIEYCNYDDINTKIQDFYNNLEDEKYERIFITDISVNEEVAKDIDGDYDLSEKILLLDHHTTAKWLNKYDWAEVIESTVLLHDYNKVTEKVSGTYLFFIELLKNDYLNIDYKTYQLYLSFVDMVRKYDTWLWKTKYNDEQPKMWNDLFYIMGRDEFVETIIYRLTHYNVFDFCDIDLQLLKYKQREIDTYIKKKQEQIIEKDILGYKAGIVFAEQFISELGNKLAEQNPQYDFIVIINVGNMTVSYRGVKDNIDLGKDIATVFGGGGHLKAAGSLIDNSVRGDLINKLFKLK